MGHHLQRRFNVVVHLTNRQPAPALLQDGPRALPRQKVTDNNVIVPEIASKMLKNIRSDANAAANLISAGGGGPGL